jgi:hypothetical protein
MKKFIAALAFTAIIASPSFAATKKVVKTTTTTTTPAVDHSQSSAPAYTSHAGYSHGAPFWGVGFGLGTVGSRFAFGPTLKAQWPVELSGNQFKFGARTGFIFGPSSPSAFTIPILATAEYEFSVANQLKPFLGLEMGLTFSHAGGSDDVTVGGVTFKGASSSSTDFALLFVPGFSFGDSHMYYFEIPLGVIATSFAIFPTVGMHF